MAFPFLDLACLHVPFLELFGSIGLPSGFASKLQQNEWGSTLPTIHYICTVSKRLKKLISLLISVRSEPPLPVGNEFLFIVIQLNYVSP